MKNYAILNLKIKCIYKYQISIRFQIMGPCVGTEKSKNEENQPTQLPKKLNPRLQSKKKSQPNQRPQSRKRPKTTNKLKLRVKLQSKDKPHPIERPKSREENFRGKIKIKSLPKQRQSYTRINKEKLRPIEAKPSKITQNKPSSAHEIKLEKIDKLLHREKSEHQEILKVQQSRPIQARQRKEQKSQEEDPPQNQNHLVAQSRLRGGNGVNNNFNFHGHFAAPTIQVISNSSGQDFRIQRQLRQYNSNSFYGLRSQLECISQNQCENRTLFR